ncbi:hypothetical protein B0H17DRAFT_1042363 [Mycena rosella]|uniref:Rho-GAP domain-containing protein n=1 Tax=Mycena rosella TaxID=1033263 RepID=A0AAD7E0Q6_MYCRO|nr:hypothetical protein B0H17DRAFT_1042363 [Mycena rosella]
MSSSSHSGWPGVASATSSLSSNSSAAAYRTAPVRSSSLAHAMGQNESKASLVSPTSPKGFYVAASTGSKLKRAFAARRKKSEDIAAGGDSQPTTNRQRSARQLTLQPLSIQAPRKFIPPPPPPLQSITPANRGSIIPITPGVSSAVNFMIGQERELSAAAAAVAEKEKDDDSKEAWRRSDATITHHTIRPGAASGTRASRPVSTAESLQSTHTVVPMNKRLSALVTDADFGMAEEDDEDRSHSNHGAASPTASVRSNKPRSMSLNVGPSQPQASSASPKLSSETAPPMTPSMSRETPTLTRAAANSTGKTFGGVLRPGLRLITLVAAHSTPAHPTQQLPVVQAQSRQPAVSISGGFAPAAGLAKRAVEKMGRAWEDSTPKHRRTPNSASSAWSINSSNHSSSISDSDAFATPPGPTLGKRLRGPLKVTSSGANAGSAVFGCRLKVVVSETAVTSGGRRGRDIEDANSPFKQANSGLPLLKLLEHRMLPALVVRCAQHILIWGVQEEGLFRVTGRPSHISKLRTEFDTGADFDMTECTPGDLDPHAVASVFKAFLRELPEPILTQGLIPYFEAALAQESTLNEQDKTPRVKGPIGPTLPSGPRNVQAMRKPPSLSTLAMPNFSSIRPPSQSLLNALKSLIGQLPPENRDLIRTVTELIRATAKQSRETKMPLSNLLLVFCPSLNMNPPLLRVLCEAEGVWGDDENENQVAPLAVVDIKRDSVLDIRAPDPAPDTAKPGTVEAEAVDVVVADTSAQHDPLPSPTRPRSPGARNKRMHPAAMYLDSQEESTLSQVSRMLAENADLPNPHPDDVSSVSTSDASTEPRLDAPSPLLSSSAESLATPSSGPSLTHLPLEGKGFDGTHSMTSLVIADSPDPQFNRSPRQPAVGEPLGSPIQFPSISNNSPGTPISLTPITSTRSIPTLSLPSLSLANLSPKFDHNSAGSAPPSPLRRLKKPSLHLLFSKRSASPLTPLSSGGYPFISGPYLHPPRAVSDSSLSTPVSAVTAPQGSSSTLPPVLDTPIESHSLREALGIADSPDPSPEVQQPSPSIAEAHLPVPGQTPIADWYRSPSSSTLAVNHLRPHPTRQVSKASLASTSSNRLGILDSDEYEEDWTQSVLLAADVDWAKQGP